MMRVMMRRIEAIALVSFVLLGATGSYAQDATIRSFEVNIPEEAIADLRIRIAAARWSPSSFRSQIHEAW